MFIVYSGTVSERKRGSRGFISPLWNNLFSFLHSINYKNKHY